MTAGFFDRVVPGDQLLDAALARAQELTQLDAKAHANTKQRVRADALEALRESVSEFGG